jgi:hypothetical protein
VTVRAAARFDPPIFIVSTPRSGSTLLFETLAQAPDLHSIWGESHVQIESIPALFPPSSGWGSNRLTASAATDAVAEQLANNLYEALRDREGRAPTSRVRMLEKTPKNALRVAFFNTVFPNARFVYLYRDVRQTLASMMEAWASGHFRTYPHLPGWTGYPWSLLLVPGWKQLIGQPLPEIVAHQWAITTNVLLNDLEQLDEDRVDAVEYSTFLTSPQSTVEKLAASLGLQWDRELGSTLPLSKVTVSPPDPQKWRRLESQIERVLPIVAQADERARAFVADRSERV